MGETAPQQPAREATTRTAIPAVASLNIDPDRLARLWKMKPAQRREAAEAGKLTLGEMLRWAARAPAGEVPIVNGEFFFITALAE
jgi:hypothetical protein